MPALLVPVFTAAGLKSGAALIAARITTSIALAAAAKALMPNPSRRVRKRTLTVREPAQPREIVYGRSRKGGAMIFAESHSDDEILNLVIAFAANPCAGIDSIYFDGRLAFDADGAAQNWIDGNAWIEKHLGDSGGSPFPILRAERDSWTAEHRLDGITALKARLRFDSGKFPQGLPNITADIRGKNDILDPRTGRRGYTENAALCVADYMANADYGIGAAIGAADGIDRAALIAAANVCDEQVALIQGGTEARYACNGVVTLDQPPKDVIESMLTASAGRVFGIGGKWEIRAGAWMADSAPLRIGPGDIIEDGLRLTTRQTAANQFNSVRGQFISETNGWQPDDFPARKSATYIAEDGGEERWQDLTLPFTISPSAAERLAKIELERSRRQMVLTAGCKLTAWGAKAGDIVEVTHEHWGFARKLFEVEEVEIQISDSGGPAILPTLTLREASPLIYSWTATEQDIYAAAPRSNLPDAFRAPAPGTPEITEENYTTRDGAGVRTRAIVDWEGDSPFTAEYEVEAQRPGSTEWIFIGRTLTRTITLPDVAAGTWHFRVRAVSTIGVASEWAEATHLITGLGDPPSAITGFQAQAAGGVAILRWDEITDIDVRLGGNVLIRHSQQAAGATWGAARTIDIVPGAEGHAVVPLMGGTYLIRARDSIGKAGPVASATTGAATLLDLTAFRTLQEDAAFRGAKAGTSVRQQRLEISESGGHFAATGSYSFRSAMDLGTARSVHIEVDMLFSARGLADTIDSREARIDDWTDFDGGDFANSDTDVRIEIRATADNPAAASAQWTEWRRTDSEEIRARGIQARAILTADSTRLVSPSISRLRIVAETAA